MKNRTLKLLSIGIGLACMSPDTLLASQIYRPIKTVKTRVDFFSDLSKLFGWSGPLTGSRGKKNGIAEIPLFAFHDRIVGEARIICYPKEGLPSWEALIKKQRSVDLEHKKVLKIASDRTEQKLFTIYAFLVEAENLKPAPGDHDPDGKAPNFPCNVLVYHLLEDGWKLTRKVMIKNWSEYSDLEFDTVIKKG